MKSSILESNSTEKLVTIDTKLNKDNLFYGTSIIVTIIDSLSWS